MLGLWLLMLVKVMMRLLLVVENDVDWLLVRGLL